MASEGSILHPDHLILDPSEHENLEVPSVSMASLPIPLSIEGRPDLMPDADYRNKVTYKVT